MAKPNIDPVDRFTVGHAAFGVMLGLWGMPWYMALGSSVTFELVENFILKPSFPKLFPVGKRDSLVNATFYTAAWMAGWGLGKAIPGQGADFWPGAKARSVSPVSGIGGRGRVGLRRNSARMYGARRNLRALPSRKFGSISTR